VSITLEDGEVWKPVPGFEGFYEVSNLGRLRSLRVNGRWGSRPRSTPRLMAPKANREGYRIAALVKLGCRSEHRVHCLVLEAFVGPRPGGMHGAHGDGDPGNNRLDNLRWATPAENIADRAAHGRTARGARQGLAKLTDDAVREIRGSSEPSPVLAARFGVSEGAIRFARRGDTWRHVA